MDHLWVNTKERGEAIPTPLDLSKSWVLFRQQGHPLAPLQVSLQPPHHTGPRLHD